MTGTSAVANKENNSLRRRIEAEWERSRVVEGSSEVEEREEGRTTRV